MHQYLKAIGFGNIKSKRELNAILRLTEESFTQHNLISRGDEMDFCEYQKEFGAGIGLALCGDMDIDECWVNDSSVCLRIAFNSLLPLIFPNPIAFRY